MDWIRRKTGVHVIVGGFDGRLNRDAFMDESLLPYVWHTGAYCLEVKKNRAMWDRCIQAKQAMIWALNRCESGVLCGHCPFGVLERSWPVRVRGKLVGVVTASCYQGDPQHAQRCIERAGKRFGADTKALWEVYQRELIVRDEDMIQAECLCATLADALATMVADGRIVMTCAGTRKNQELVARAMDFIYSRADSDIRVGDVARFCNVSESHLQHLFRRVRGRGMVSILADVRLERAQTLLREGRLSVRQVAEQCGFSDPNYFSTVFSSRYGMPPSEYRAGPAQQEPQGEREPPAARF